MKLELKHICGYFPYKLQWYREGFPTIEQTDFNTKADYSKKDLKPCLLPLSALTEPMEDGSVPIVELAKIAFPNHEWYLNSFGTHAKCDTGRLTFEFDDAYNIFLMDNSGSMNQLQLSEYLFAHHFDIYDLIGAGLAIDKRTIK